MHERDLVAVDDQQSGATSVVTTRRPVRVKVASSCRVTHRRASSPSDRSSIRRKRIRRATVWPSSSSPVRARSAVAPIADCTPPEARYPDTLIVRSLPAQPGLPEGVAEERQRAWSVAELGRDDVGEAVLDRQATAAGGFVQLPAANRLALTVQAAPGSMPDGERDRETSRTLRTGRRGRSRSARRVGEDGLDEVRPFGGSRQRVTSSSS